jgi:hypothetical protein
MDARTKALWLTAGALAIGFGGSASADLSRGFFPNSASTSFADVNGDGRADAIAVGDGVVTFMGTNTGDGPGIVVRLATPSNTFGPSQWFTSDMFAGELATVFTDITGDGRADGIAVDRIGITRRISNGTSLLPRANWLTRRTFAGGSLPSDATFAFANLDGRPGTEAIAVSRGWPVSFPEVFVATGSDREWLPAAIDQGEITTLFGDVTGDGRADVVAINNGNVTVQQQVNPNAIPWSLAFGNPIPFTNEPFFGNVATHVADVNGDGRADLIALNTTGINVRLSNGNSFDACTRTPALLHCSSDFMSEKWSETPFTGEVGTYFAPVAMRNPVPVGGRPVDVIAVSRAGITVRISNLQEFSPVVSTFSSQPFFGEAFAIFTRFRLP